MKYRLKRFYGFGHLHFITCSCYRREPLLGTTRSRNMFLKILNDVRRRYDFSLVGYTVMPEHIHVLMSEPNVGTPSTVMQVLKQRVSRALHARRRRTRTSPGQRQLWDEAPAEKREPFWQRRFYDFNVWTWKKKNEKLNYMHFNPVKRGLVKHPKDWEWSSYGFYAMRKPNLCPPNPLWEPKPKPAPQRQRSLAHPSQTP